MNSERYLWHRSCIAARRSSFPVTVEYTRYKIHETRRAAFEKAYANAARSLAASSHCLAYELSYCTESPEHYVLRVEWDSEEGHLKGFRSSPEFKTFFALVLPFVNDIEEMRHYAVLSSDRKQIESETLLN